MRVCWKVSSEWGLDMYVELETSEVEGIVDSLLQYTLSYSTYQISVLRVLNIYHWTHTSHIISSYLQDPEWERLYRYGEINLNISGSFYYENSVLRTLLDTREPYPGLNRF